ncbi:MAG TPA: LD-carboxypeptidase [Gammaproteobacteria bacterium]|nr:LD-carboxypeptidase [Gammaproteobacteria bacterium]
MHKLIKLQPGDSVEIIAPASRCTDQHLSEIKNLLASWQLECLVSSQIFGKDLLCANSDEMRFDLLKNALQNPKTKALICARGGYGSMRLIPELAKCSLPISPKLLVGMSDITALNLFFQQAWQWPVLHGALAKDKFSAESIASLKTILMGEVNQVEFSGVSLNAPAESNRIIETSVTGGNLCLVQSSIGTLWQIDAKNKIILLEEIGERAYRVDRMLEHLQQANIFKDAAAVLLGDFLEGKEPDGSSLIQAVLDRFARASQIPVVQVRGIGHGYNNFPIPLGTRVELKLGKEIKLICRV